ncbi:CHAT domain-containing protein [Mycena venus]|uniref:CHAT domain-containing protein n=1 Tax=Mycena venus TaxID=2733690 RepID=A0A8H6Y141_9AGAR|nr:CHAT domain-containing protein [Mycena venus]
MLPPSHKDHIALDTDDALYRKLNSEWDQALNEVRQQPGFAQFLRPKLMTELRVSATNGPIIILNASKSTCAAFIVTASQDVRCVRLDNMSFDYAQFLVELLRATLKGSLVQISQFLAHSRQTSGKSPVMLQRLLGKLENEEDYNPDDVFRAMLKVLWENVVRPVFNILKLKKSDSPSRLWWCPTGPFTFLPIHAAGLYEELGTDSVSDYVVSSYTPTLTSLLDPHTEAVSAFKMTAVIQPETPGLPSLPATRNELLRIRKVVPQKWLTSLGDTPEATVDIATRHLKKSSVVHFACHGTQDLQNPLETGLHLTDGRLRVSEFMRGTDHVARKKSMSLAFLSACETAKGDDNAPDEAMHLAATLLFSGFRGVVATMWTMADADGPEIAEPFYEYLFKGCDADADPPVLPDLTKGAEALHIAVAKLRTDPTVSFTRWVPFVHYGL